MADSRGVQIKIDSIKKDSKTNQSDGDINFDFSATDDAKPPTESLNKSLERLRLGDYENDDDAKSGETVEGTTKLASANTPTKKGIFKLPNELMQYIFICIQETVEQPGREGHENRLTATCLALTCKRLYDNYQHLWQRREEIKFILDIRPLNYNDYTWSQFDRYRGGYIQRGIWRYGVPARFILDEWFGEWWEWNPKCSKYRKRVAPAPKAALLPRHKDMTVWARSFWSH